LHWGWHVFLIVRSRHEIAGNFAVHHMNNIAEKKTLVSMSRIDACLHRVSFSQD
jgi:hypothetical protein